jgi:ABC-type branched-subunit amino acid transport system substrate-binding protein
MKIRLVICVLLLGLVGSAAEIQAANLRSKQRVKIGVLASLTGSGSSLGKKSRIHA